MSGVWIFSRTTHCNTPLLKKGHQRGFNCHECCKTETKFATLANLITKDEDNPELKVIVVADESAVKPLSESQLVLVLFLITFKNGAGFLISQSRSTVTVMQTNYLATLKQKPFYWKAIKVFMGE